MEPEQGILASKEVRSILVLVIVSTYVAMYVLIQQIARNISKTMSLSY